MRALAVLMVLVLLLPASRVDAQGPAQEAVDAAIAGGVEFLRSKQEEDGSWRYSGSARPGCTALVVYALIKSGVNKDDAAIARALRLLARTDINRTYDVSCLLMALTAIDADEHRDWIEELVDKLVSWQRPEGYWGYPGGGDLSNTQYGALGLRAAGMAGIEVPPIVWVKLLSGLDSFRAGRGAYSYSNNPGGTGTMTAAGVGTLAICDAMLTAEGLLEARDGHELREKREAGLEWLGSRASQVLSLAGGWPYYRLYGIERVGGLVGVTTIGGLPWYAVGAEAILAQQATSGGWGRTGTHLERRGGQLVEVSPADPVLTSFALLFLRRATHGAVTGRYGVSSDTGRHFATADKTADVQLAASGELPLTLWVAGFGADLLERMEWPREKGAGPRVLWVDYFDGARFIGRAEGAEDEPARFSRFPIRHEFSVPGTHRLHANVRVFAPPSDTFPSGLTTTVESSELTVPIEQVIPQWVSAQEHDRARNLMPSASPRARASSGDAQFAIDHKQRTSWLADVDDKDPTLSIDLRTPVKADVILFANARTVPFEAGAVGRALELEVRVNGADPIRLSMPPEARQKGRVELPEAVLVRRLEVTIPWQVVGSVLSNAGLAEVELQLGE